MLSAIALGVASGTNPIPRRFSKTKESQSSSIIACFITFPAINGESGITTGVTGKSSFMMVVFSKLPTVDGFLSKDLINCAVFSSEADELSLVGFLSVVGVSGDDVVVFSSEDEESDDDDDDDSYDLLDAVVDSADWMEDFEVDGAVVSSFDFLYSLDSESFFLDFSLSASSFAFWAVKKRI